MKTRHVWVVVCFALLAGAAGCTSPCHNFCKAVDQKIQDCGFGPSAGDDAIDSCAKQIQATYSNETCNKGASSIEQMSCADFAELIK